MTIQLTEPELSFIADMVTSYRTKRVKTLAKAVRKSPSADLETLSLNTLVSKLNSLYLDALNLAYSDHDSSLPSPVTTHADVELQLVTPIESLG